MVGGKPEERSPLAEYSEFVGSVLADCGYEAHAATLERFKGAPLKTQEAYFFTVERLQLCNELRKSSISSQLGISFDQLLAGLLLGCIESIGRLHANTGHLKFPAWLEQRDELPEPDYSNAQEAAAALWDEFKEDAVSMNETFKAVFTLLAKTDALIALWSSIRLFRVGKVSSRDLQFSTNGDTGEPFFAHTNRRPLVQVSASDQSSEKDKQRFLVDVRNQERSGALAHDMSS